MEPTIMGLYRVYIYIRVILRLQVAKTARFDPKPETALSKQLKPSTLQSPLSR